MSEVKDRYTVAPALVVMAVVTFFMVSIYGCQTTESSFLSVGVGGITGGITFLATYLIATKPTPIFYCGNENCGHNLFFGCNAKLCSKWRAPSWSEI